MPARRVKGYCPLCRSRCGCISTVEDGRLVSVEPDPAHPTGSALCAKGRAAPELVHSPDRLLHPMKRTRPKGDPDPGWTRITWDEALDATAAALRRLAAEGGPESVAFAVTTPSGTALSDAIQWIERLIRAFGSPNNCYGTEICNWHKDVASAYTYGAGIGMPDFPDTGCLVLWGHNPSAAWLAEAQGAAGAKAGGARLVVVDPRRVGLAPKADEWLRVRPGTDGALALGIAGEMIARGRYDAEFVRRWTNGPFLVRDDTGRFLRAEEVGAAGDFVAWDAAADRLAARDPGTGAFPEATDPALFGGFTVETPDGPVACWPAFQLYADLCAAWPAERVAQTCWVPAQQVRRTAELLWEARPVSYYAWSGVGQHTNATQTDRAICLLYALTGSYDAPGGNVHFAKVPTNDVSGAELMPEEQAAKALGRDRRPLGPARTGWITTDDLCRAVLEHEPYAVRGLVGFGTNLAVSRAAPERTRQALKALDFYVHADMFANPSADIADILLPVTTPWEREGLRVGFETGQAANERVQLRPAALDPAGEARSDAWIVFELAKRLGLGDRFWDGDIDAGMRHMLAPSGLTPEALRASPGGVRVPLETAYRKYAGDGAGPAPGFATPTGRVEIYSERFLEHGYAPLPAFEEPAMGPARRPELAPRYPLVLTSAKAPQFCHSQHRNLPRLRRTVPDPVVELHPEAAAARGIADGAWVRIYTPAGSARARARLREAMDPRVAAAQHGWWQGCAELGLPGFDPFSADGANYNRLIDDDATDPVSGSVAHRSFLCEIRPADAD